MRFFQLPALVAVVGAGLTGCKQEEDEPAVPNHIARQHDSRIGGSHRWNGSSRDYYPGVYDIRGTLPDTTFAVSYINDTTVRVAAIDMTYYQNEFFPSDSTGTFTAHDIPYQIDYNLTYYIRQDSLVYEVTDYSIYSM